MHVPAGPLPLSTQEIADVLRKEQLNSYGILAPQWYVDKQQSAQDMDDEEEEEDGGRVLRGSAIYALASLINHECNPNVARFDNFDMPRPDNTKIVFRAMHDLPPGK